MATVIRRDSRSPRTLPRPSVGSHRAEGLPRTCHVLRTGWLRALLSPRVTGKGGRHKPETSILRAQASGPPHPELLLPASPTLTLTLTQAETGAY